MLPFYYGIANQFSIADRYFASALTQTFPNRFYLLAGTSFGHIRNDLPPTAVTRRRPSSNCSTQAPRSAGRSTSRRFRGRAAVHVRAEAPEPRRADLAVLQGRRERHAAAGVVRRVRPVRRREPESDEHPPANVQVGEKFTHDVMQALVNSPNWSSSAMFLTYDEHGGYYDHVAPPAAPSPTTSRRCCKPGDTPGAFDRYGIRVPAHRHLAVREEALRLAHGLRPHVDPALHRDPLRAPDPHQPRQGRRPDARHVRLHHRDPRPSDTSRRPRRPQRCKHLAWLRP